MEILNWLLRDGKKMNLNSKKYPYCGEVAKGTREHIIARSQRISLCFVP